MTVTGNSKNVLNKNSKNKYTNNYFQFDQLKG